MTPKLFLSKDQAATGFGKRTSLTDIEDRCPHPGCHAAMEPVFRFGYPHWRCPACRRLFARSLEPTKPGERNA